MGKIIRRILTIIPAVALQSLWLLLLMKWLTPYAPIIVSLLSVAAFFLVVEFAIFRNLHMTPMRSFFLVSVSRL